MTALIKYSTILIIAFAFFYLYIRIRGLRAKTSLQFDDNMPANLWFYDQLINIEINPKKASAKKLKKCFIAYLYRKYHITKTDLRKNTIFDIVAQREKNAHFIELYGDIYNTTQEMKHSHPSDVIAYIKSIKYVFNQDNVSDWIATRQTKKEKCNDC